MRRRPALQVRSHLERVLNVAARLCRQRNCELTPLRRHVLGLLLAAGRPIKAYDLLPSVKDGGQARPATLYRALDFLMKARLAHRIVSRDAYLACAHPEGCSAPLFLLCQGCGAAEEVESRSGVAKVLEAATGFGFAPREAVFEIAGQCPRCAPQ